MKNLVISISILIMSLSLSAQGEVAYTVIKGFNKNQVYTKSSSKQQLLRHLKLNARHELRTTGHGDQRYQHFYDGIPVKYSTVTFNTYGYGGTLYLFDNYDESFVFSYDDVIDLYKDDDFLIDLSKHDVRKMLLPVDGEIQPIYEITLHALDIAKSRIAHISGITGKVIAEEPIAIPHGQPVFARSIYDGTVIMDVRRDSGIYSLSHEVLDHRTFDLATSVDMDSTNDISGSNRILVEKQDAVQAHYALGVTLDYFSLRHGRESFDNEGAIVQSYINYGDNSNMAFWSQGNIVLGGGDGVHYGDMSAIDIVAHEFTHGVVDYTADLRYSGESGALNESFADIFGEMTEYFAKGKCDWESGSQVGLSSRVRFRRFSNPASVNLPDTYQGDFWINTECGSPNRINDYCGVHTNSSIQNKWFYLLANGGQGVNDNGDSYEVMGISANAAATIAYKNLTEYLWSTAGFDDAREGSIMAAREIYGDGSMQVIATTNAWYAVGVGDLYIDEANTADTISSIKLLVSDITDSSITITWNPVNGLDSVLYSVELNNQYYSTTVDSNFNFIELSDDSLYDISLVGYIDSTIVALSDTISVRTLSTVMPDDTLVAYYFEEGLDGWEVSYDDAKWYQGKRSPEGNGSIRLRDDMDNNSTLSPWIDLNGSSSFDVSFIIYAWSVEYGERFNLEYRTSLNSWTTLANLMGRSDFHNYLNQSYHYDRTEVSGDSIQFRISLDASANSDHIYFDEFIVKVSQKVPLFKTSASPNIHIWPNPTSEWVQITDGHRLSDIRIFDATGRVIYRSNRPQIIHVLQTASLNSGLYYVQFAGEEPVSTKSLIVK